MLYVDNGISLFLPRTTDYRLQTPPPYSPVTLTTTAFKYLVSGIAG